MPRVWAIITAFVRGDRASSSLATSTLYVGSVTSTKTGTIPSWMTGATVVGKPAATVITSSPARSRRSPSRWLVSVATASRFADEPELTSRAVDTPYQAASSSSSRACQRPPVSQNSRLLSTRLTISSSP